MEINSNEDQFSRTRLLLGDKGVDRLNKSHVAVFGVGGVGGYVCEALVRSGIGEFDLIDNDIVNITNINRQIIASYDTVGRYKTEVMKERMLTINPKVKVNIYNCFFLPENADIFPFEKYDYIVDAVDTVAAKIELIMKADKYKIPIISAMGAGNKLKPEMFKLSDIYDTRICPLARTMRRELKKRGIEKLKVVYSEEEPVNINKSCNNEDNNYDRNESKKRIIGSVSFVPAVAGLILAGEIIKDIVGSEMDV